MNFDKSQILNKTQSICPICHKPIEAFYIEEEGKVYFTKTCPLHGDFKTIAADCSEDYIKWIGNPVVNIAPEKSQTTGDSADNSCPLHCGLCNNHLQTACCVLIDVTSRCNQHCPYCFAKAENNVDPNEPTLDELSKKFDLLMELGEDGRPFNIQISGGEPTIRHDLPEIIAMAKAKGFEYIQLNSNGRKIALDDGYAEILKKSGTSVVFMQFDGTCDDIYESLRGEPLLEIKKKAIANCEKVGLAVALVPTIVNGVNDDNIGEILDFAVENVNVVKGVHFQPVSFFGRHPEKPDSIDEDTKSVDAKCQTYSGDFKGRITMFELLHLIERQRPSFKYHDFCPISTGHTLCCFYSTYIREPDGSVRCTLTKEQREQGISCCDTTTVQADSCCCETNIHAEQCCCEADSSVETCCCTSDGIDELEIIKRDRDFVLNKWDIAPPDEKPDWSKYKSSMDIVDMDDFYNYYKQNTLTVTGMAFQDVNNLDAERVKRCRVQVLSDDNKLIPFCAYNSIYRK